MEDENNFIENTRKIIENLSDVVKSIESNKEDTLRDKLNKHGQLEDEGAPEDEI